MSGSCDLYCTSGELDSFGAIVPYDALIYGGEMMYDCPDGFSGGLKLSCENGNLTIMNGRCYQNCLSDIHNINEIEIEIDFMAEHSESVVVPCPSPDYIGEMELLCIEGNILHVDDSCISNCVSREIETNGHYLIVPVVNHGSEEMMDCSILNIEYIGVVAVSCAEGNITLESGECILQDRCPENSVELKMLGTDDVSVDTYIDIIFPELHHGQVLDVSCPEKYLGTITLTCNNGTKTHLHGTCVEDLDCSTGELEHEDVIYMYPALINGQGYVLTCDNEKYSGEYVIECVRGFINVLVMNCFRRCFTGEMQVLDHRITYPDLKHEEYYETV
eukprot:UN34271